MSHKYSGRYRTWFFFRVCRLVYIVNEEAKTLSERAYYEELLSADTGIGATTRKFMEECLELDYYTVFQTEEELREKGIDHIPSKSHNKQLLGFWVPLADEDGVKYFCKNLIGPLRMSDE